MKAWHFDYGLWIRRLEVLLGAQEKKKTPKEVSMGM